MLVVIAVIAVLVAIVIPTVNAVSEKAKEAADLSNVRSAYSKVMMAALMDDTSQTGDVTYMHGRWYMNVDLKQQPGWQSGGNLSIGGVTSDDSLHWVGNPCPGSATVTGYIYKIQSNGASTLLKNGTAQEIDTYTNAQGQEKLDVYGNQNKNIAPTNRVYSWDI